VVVLQVVVVQASEVVVEPAVVDKAAAVASSVGPVAQELRFDQTRAGRAAVPLAVDPVVAVQVPFDQELDPVEVDRASDQGLGQVAVDLVPDLAAVVLVGAGLELDPDVVDRVAFAGVDLPGLVQAGDIHRQHSV